MFIIFPFPYSATSTWSLYLLCYWCPHSSVFRKSNFIKKGKRFYMAVKNPGRLDNAHLVTHSCFASRSFCHSVWYTWIHFLRTYSNFIIIFIQRITQARFLRLSGLTLNLIAEKTVIKEENDTRNYCKSNKDVMWNR